MNWFKPRIEYKVVEIEKPVARLSEQDAKNIASLEHHPGLESLVARLRSQRAALELELKTGSHKDLMAVYNLQNGIKWTQWLEKQITFYTSKKDNTSRPAFDLEEQEFRRIAEALQIVGRSEAI